MRRVERRPKVQADAARSAATLLGLRVSERFFSGFRTEQLHLAPERVEIERESLQAEIAQELARAPYDLLVLGGHDHGPLGQLYLGSTVESVVARSRVSLALLVAHGGPEIQ
ncbi:universal stress protein [Sorangium sp. So ce448]|uniref:universal stress protein n=1 Tax=Sorangium sp. So ce448 TaxID=3133314 RepID=UPI003F614481